MSDSLVKQLSELALTIERGQGRSTITGAIGEIERQKAIAEGLYTALAQMKHRRGIHIDDIDVVLSAMEAWEEANEELARD